jgi:hypothetical protein
MIVAIVLAEPQPSQDGEQPYFSEHGESAVLDQAVSRVLRGPFGGTVIATTSELEEECQELLDGFAVKYAVADDASFVAKAGLLEAAAFRKRWEKIMAGAAQRFNAGGKKKSGKAQAAHDHEDEEDEEGGTADWKSLQKSGDVKVRGLARSFDCDGVMLFRGDRPDLKLETQAALVEAFAREGAGKNFARVSYKGKPGYPVLANLQGFKELEALPLDVPLDTWLAKNEGKILVVPVDDPGV